MGSDDSNGKSAPHLAKHPSPSKRESTGPFGVLGGAYGELTEVGLQVKAAPLSEAFKDRLPLLRELHDINEHFGVEIAQTVFSTVVEQVPPYGPFLKRVRAFDLKSLTSSELKNLASEYEVTFVASQLPLSGRKWADHVEDWRAWARSLGFKTDVITTLPGNDLWANAAIISSHLLSNPHPNRILVTLGQGATEFRSLLTRRLGVRGGVVHDASGSGADHGGELDSIKLWLNVAGAYGGSSVTRYWKRSLLSKAILKAELFLSGRKEKVVHQIDARLSAFKSQPQFPRDMQVINIVGLPFRHQLPSHLIATYHELSKTSPNDGMVDLYSSIAHPGLIVPIIGMSHRVENVKLEPIFKRALGVFLTDRMKDRVAPKAPTRLSLELRDLE